MIFVPEKSLFSSNRLLELTGSFQCCEISLFEAVIRRLSVKKSTYVGAVHDSTNISAADRLNGAWSGSEELIFFLWVSQSSRFVALSSTIVELHLYHRFMSDAGCLERCSVMLIKSSTVGFNPTVQRHQWSRG